MKSDTPSRRLFSSVPFPLSAVGWIDVVTVTCGCVNELREGGGISGTSVGLAQSQRHHANGSDIIHIIY